MRLPTFLLSLHANKSLVLLSIFSTVVLGMVNLLFMAAKKAAPVSRSRPVAKWYVMLLNGTENFACKATSLLTKQSEAIFEPANAISITAEKLLDFSSFSVIIKIDKRWFK